MTPIKLPAGWTFAALLAGVALGWALSGGPAEATAAATFGSGGLGDDLPVLDVPSEGIRLGAACTAVGFTASNGEAKRKIAEGAVRIDDEAVIDPGFLVTVASGTERKLSLGRKRHAILRGS